MSFIHYLKESLIIAYENIQSVILEFRVFNFTIQKHNSNFVIRFVYNDRQHENI